MGWDLYANNGQGIAGYGLRRTLQRSPNTGGCHTLASCPAWVEGL